MQARIRELKDNNAVQILMTIARKGNAADAITPQRAPEILDLLAGQLGAIPSTEEIPKVRRLGRPCCCFLRVLNIRLL
jgi:hypothetical protein